MDFKYDVIVIGAGHAGCEAAAAAANLGSKTCLITMDMNKIGQMSCNPAVGGIAKGQIVREIDALGGYMGLVTDKTAIQFRILNRSKGPAMWSPRAQCDRNKFIWAWREILENTPNLHIWQDTVCEILVENGEVVGLTTLGSNFPRQMRCTDCRNFLNGLMHVGHTMLPGGRMAEPASYQLTESIAPTWHHIRTNENGNSRTHRRTERTLRKYGHSRRGKRLPQVLLYEQRRTPFEATPMLDLFYQRGSASYPS